MFRGRSPYNMTISRKGLNSFNLNLFAFRGLVGLCNFNRLNDLSIDF